MNAVGVSTYTPQQVKEKKSTALSLRHNFAWTLLGNVVYAACQWGMLIVLAKLGTPEMVGQFALGLAVTAPVFMLTNLQLRGIQATDATAEYQFADYFGLRLLMTLLALCGIGGVVFWSDYRAETACVVLVVGLAKACESLSDVCYGFFQQHERMDRIAKSLILKGALSLFALGGVILLTKSVLWGTFAMTAVWVELFLIYDLRSVYVCLLESSPRAAPLSQARGLSVLFFLPRWSSATLSNLVRLSLPLGIVMTLISLNTTIPRYVIERVLGEHLLGIYAALAYLMVAGNTVISALGQSATPRLARYYAASNRRAFAILLFKLCNLGAIIAIAGVFVADKCGPNVLQLLYGPEYAVHTEVFLWLMVASGISYISSFLGYGMTATRYFKIQAPLFGSVVGVTLVMCSLLVPKSGLIGAAQASVIAAIVGMVGGLFVNFYAVWQLSLTRQETE